MTSTVRIRLVLLAWLWGSEFLFVNIALRSMGAVELVCIRLALAAILLFAIAFARRERLPRNDRVFYAHCFVLGTVATLAPYFLMAIAQQRISSALTGILVGTAPLATAAMALLFLPHEGIGLARVSGLVAGLCGVVLVIDPWNTAVGGNLWGAIAALGTALCFAIGYVYNARFLSSHHASGPMIMAVQSLFGALVAASWLLVDSRFRFDADIESLATIAMLGFVNTGAAAIVFFSLIRLAGAVGASLVEYLMVLVAVVLGVTFLDESVSLTTAGGTVLVLFGVYLAERGGDPVAEVER